MIRIVFFVLLAWSMNAGAIVIRHDVDAAAYLAQETEFPALVDLPGEGHGVLIAPQWVVTAAHATQWQAVDEVMLDGKPRKVERLIVHPGYKVLPAALQSGDAAPAMAFLASSDDIALIRLTEAVTDVAPAVLHREGDELGRLVKLFGKGATGNGAEGQDRGGPNRTVLRHAFNRIASAEGRWLGYVFDAGDAAHALEGMPGNGDSGGPVLVEVDGQWQLAGLASWKYWEGDLAGFKAGFYGQTSYQVRLSSYVAWIESVMTSDALVEAPVRR